MRSLRGRLGGLRKSGILQRVRPRGRGWGRDAEGNGQPQTDSSWGTLFHERLKRTQGARLRWAWGVEPEIQQAGRRWGARQPFPGARCPALSLRRRPGRRRRAVPVRTSHRALSTTKSDHWCDGVWAGSDEVDTVGGGSGAVSPQNHRPGLAGPTPGQRPVRDLPSSPSVVPPLVSAVSPETGLWDTPWK